MGGVCPNALSPLCWDSSCWYATGVIGWGKVKDGLKKEINIIKSVSPLKKTLIKTHNG